MPWRIWLGVVLAFFGSPILVLAGNAEHEAAHLTGLPFWAVLPFVGILLAIAFLPLIAEHFWHSNRNRLLVSVAFAAPVILYLAVLDHYYHQPGFAALLETLHEYIAFICLLGSLYIVSGGIMVDLNVRPSPLINTLILACGAVLANLIGTTGASMLLIRPFLRINKPRQFTKHLPIFFIFIVSNLGGLLTPLGDPPLFLGFLRGVDFFWTLRLWPQWSLANFSLLGVFLIWDTIAYFRDPGRTSLLDAAPVAPTQTFRLRGWVNLFLLAGILLGVLFQSEKATEPLGQWLKAAAQTEFDFTFRFPVGESVMVAMSLLSLLLTPRGLRKGNSFGWGPIVEVAVLFAGIFITMVPALALLREHGASFGVTKPWQFFWLTGLLSSFLDNAPTYLTFVTMAAAGAPEGEPVAGWLMLNSPHLLEAISCGAVFMGAMTYIGNGPNFMVKAIADASGYRTPSFFGYLAYSLLILVPIFIVLTLIFFSGTS